MVSFFWSSSCLSRTVNLFHKDRMTGSSYLVVGFLSFIPCSIVAVNATFRLLDARQRISLLASQSTCKLLATSIPSQKISSSRKMHGDEGSRVVECESSSSEQGILLTPDTATVSSENSRRKRCAISSSSADVGLWASVTSRACMVCPTWPSTCGLSGEHRQIVCQRCFS